MGEADAMYNSSIFVHQKGTQQIDGTRSSTIILVVKTASVSFPSFLRYDRVLGKTINRMNHVM
jgi:hypothetical protein